jgi:Family of unknown function (DUF6788)
MQPERIEQQIRKIKEELVSLGPMRPGSLSRQYSVCGKPGCACADPGKPKKHGPFYQLSYAHQGKSSTRFVRPDYVPQLKKELATYKHFRQLTQTWVALEIALSQQRLEQARQQVKR